jgi:hypothetical protein
MKKYQSDIARTVHKDAEGSFRLGLIDAKRMHEYDVQCLVPSRVPIRETSYSSGGEDSRLSEPIPAVAAARA